MNHLELGVQATATVADAAIPKPSAPGASSALVWNGSTWVAATLVDANVAAGAAIAYSKLSLAGGIVNNDINGSAAIAYSKLALSNSIVNADVASAAAIALSKLADPGSGNVVTSAGAGTVAAKPPGYELGVGTLTAASTSIVSTTEATGTTIVSVTFTGDGTACWVEFYCPATTSVQASGGFSIFSLFESSTQLARLATVTTPQAAQMVVPVYAKFKVTPTAASHTYTITAFVSATTGTPAVLAGNGSTGGYAPAFIRVSKV